MLQSFNLRPFDFSRPGVKDFKLIDFNHIYGIGRSENGSQGVLFLECDAGAFVIKGSRFAALEYFTYFLFKMLKLDVPEMRLIKWTDPLFNIVKLALDQSTFRDQTLNRLVKNKLKTPYLLMMEYVPGSSIYGMGLKRAATVFSSASQEGQDRLVKLGMILAADTFINNYDRYPLLWDNEGNVENIMVRIAPSPANPGALSSTKDLKNPDNLDVVFGSFVPLDNNPNPLDKNNRMAAPNIAAYHTRLETFIKEILAEVGSVKELAESQPDSPLWKILSDRKENFKSLKRVSTLIYNYTLYQMTPQDEAYLLFGLISGYRDIVSLGKGRIDCLYKELVLPEKDDWCATWKSSYDKIIMSFFEDTFEVLEKSLKHSEACLDWTEKEILKGRFEIDFDKQLSTCLEQLKYLKQDKFGKENGEDYKVGEDFGLEFFLIKEKLREEDKKRMEEDRKRIEEQKNKTKQRLKEERLKAQALLEQQYKMLLEKNK